MKVKLRKIGNSLGVILPKEVLARMHVGEGDDLMLGEGPEGVTLSHYRPEVADQLEVAREIMSKRRNILKALAQ
jgi:putative addiction module antidote